MTERKPAGHAIDDVVFENAPVAIIMIGADTRVRRVNRCAAAMAGAEPEALIGRSPGDVVHCLNRLDDPQGCGYGDMCATCELRSNATTAMATGEPQRQIAASVPIDPVNDERLVHLIADFVPVSLGDEPGLLVYMQDVTAVRQTQDELLLKGMALDQIEDRVTVTDLDGIIKYVNDAASRTLLRPSEDIVGKHVSTYGEDPTRGATQNDILVGTLANGSWRGEIINRASDGREFVLDVRTSQVVDADGKVVALCGVSTDVTERKHREELLRESERRFRHLHEQLPLGYFCLDAEGYYQDTNPAWQRLVGATRESLHRRHFVGHLDTAEESRFRDAIEKLGEGDSQQIELRIQDSAGQPVIIFCVGRATLAADGAVEASHWVAVDVSARRELEQQLRQAQKMDALGRLAAGVAHDFNNQITVIRGYCDMLAQPDLDADTAAHAVDQIRRASERANTTTNHLLAFSRRRAFEARPTDLNALLQDLHHPVAKMIGERIRVRIEAAPRLPLVMVDPGAMQQAVLNLIINARDAMPDGGNLALRTKRLRAAGEGGLDEIVLEVEDDGQGIPADQIDRVCEPFFTTKGPDQGTGLGLAMVSSFAEQAGGRLKIDSVEGRGTTVSIVLLSDPAQKPLAAVEGEAEAVPTAMVGRVLVVEDSDEVRRVVTAVLREHSVEVVAAGSPGQAVELATKALRPFDVLLTDMVMPDMNGDDLAELLLARGYVRRVLFMSGYTGHSEPPRLGPLISKPFTSAELLAAVDRQLQAAGAATDTSARGGIS